MPPSHSVIRRYTPPTCTLEVLAQSSPLSRWMGKAVLKQLIFELRFDDPRLPEERRVPIRGDRDQLEALYDEVTSYVQGLLQQSPESFWVSFSGSQESSKVSDDSESTDPQPTLLSTQTLKSFPSQIPGAKIYLEPNSNLTHNLFLGSLANPSSGLVIQLSLLQLFDLATALDEYSADVMALPTLNNSSSVTRFPAWAPAAAVLVLAVGFTPFTWQYANSIKQKPQQTATTADSTQEQLASVPPPPVNFPTPQPGLTPPDNFSSLPLLGSTPPPLSSSVSTAPLKNPDLNVSKLPTLPNSGLAPGSLPSSQGTTIPLPPTIELNPQPNTTKAISPAENALPKRRSLPPSLSSTTGNIPPLATIPNNSRGNTLPQVYSPLDPGQPTARINSSGAGGNSLVDKLGSEPKTPTSTQVSTNGTLFDTPQVAEAREFLKKRWQPPAGLNQTLEYSMILGVDGTIERILPLGKAARDYFDTVGIPAIGAPFVSSNTAGKNLRLRVVLGPDGKVQTFQESE
jgi:Domain of unknown function (DUF4335)